MIARDACTVGDKVEVGYWVRRGDDKELDTRPGYVTELTDTTLTLSLTVAGHFPVEHRLAAIEDLRILRKAVATRDR